MKIIEFTIQKPTQSFRILNRKIQFFAVETLLRYLVMRTFRNLAIPNTLTKIEHLVLCIIRVGKILPNYAWQLNVWKFANL